MPRSPLDSFVTARVLNAVEKQTENAQNADQAPMRNVCAHVPSDLADAVDTVVAQLGCRKRAFIETALREAVQHAHEVAHNEGLDLETREPESLDESVFNVTPRLAR